MGGQEPEINVQGPEQLKVKMYDDDEKGGLRHNMPTYYEYITNNL